MKNAILCCSNYAIQEARINLSEEHQLRRLGELTAGIQLFDALPRALPSRISLPEKDLPILFAAMEARATHLVTGDVRHFGPYFGKSIEGILVILPVDYLKKRRSE